MPRYTEEQFRQALANGLTIDERYSVDKTTTAQPAQREPLGPNVLANVPVTPLLPPQTLERRVLRKGEPVPLEHDEQAALFRFIDLWIPHYPLLQLLFAIPNGAKLPYSRNAKGQRYSKQAKILIEEGLRSGVPDLCLPVPSMGRHGMFIEMKRSDRSNHPSPEQRWWIAQLQTVGYHCVVCYGAGEAWQAIAEYLGISRDLGVPV